MEYKTREASACQDEEESWKQILALLGVLRWPEVVAPAPGFSDRAMEYLRRCLKGAPMAGRYMRSSRGKGR